MHLLTVLGAGSLVSGCRQGRLPLRPHPLAYRRLSPCVPKWPSFCACLHLNLLFYKDVGLGTILMTSFYVNHLFKGPPLNTLAVRTSTYESGGHGRVTIQPMTQVELICHWAFGEISSISICFILFFQCASRI